MMIVLVKCRSYNDGTFWGVIEGVMEEELEKVREIREAIKANPDQWNWTNDTKLVNDGGGRWKTVKRIYDTYPNIKPETLDWFASFIPWRTETIEEIKVIDGEDRIL